MGTGPQGTSGEVRWTHGALPCAFSWGLGCEDGARGHPVPALHSGVLAWHTPGKLDERDRVPGGAVSREPSGKRERERTVVLGKASDVATERWDPWGPQQGEPGLGTAKQVQVPSAGRAGGTGYHGGSSETGRDVLEPQVAPGAGAQERVT